MAGRTLKIADTAGEESLFIRAIEARRKVLLKEGMTPEFAAAYARAEVLGEAIQEEYRMGIITQEEAEGKMLSLFADATPIRVKFNGFMKSIERGSLAGYRYIFEGHGAKAIKNAEERQSEPEPEQQWNPVFTVLNGNEEPS